MGFFQPRYIIYKIKNKKRLIQKRAQVFKVIAVRVGLPAVGLLGTKRAARGGGGGGGVGGGNNFL